MTEETKKEILADLAWGGGVVAVALGATLARKLGYIDHDTVKRLVFGMIGLMLAHFGNRLPKSVVPSLRARQAKRVAGWSLVLSGLVYAGLFVFAPIPVAAWFGSATVLAGITVTLGYCLSLRHKPEAV